MTSFNINTKAHSDARKQNKIASMKKSPNENERKIADKKLRPSMKVDLPSVKKEDIKLVDKIIGEEKCGNGMYWCNNDKKCKKISRSHGGNVGTNKGEIEEDVTIEDAFGNKFVEFIDLIKPKSLLSQREEKDHEVSMAHKQINKSQENLKKVKKSIGKKEKNLPAWMQAKLTDTEHNTDAVAGYTAKEGMNLAKADMGDVIKDFRKSKKPQFKGKSDKKIRQMAIAAKLEAERQNEEVELGEAVRLPSEFGHLLSVIVTWRGNTQYLRMFFPQSKLPTRSEIQSEIEKVYPGGRVIQYSTSDLPSNHANFDSPLFKVTKEEVEIEESCCKKCKKSPCKCPKNNYKNIEEKKGLWDNIHARHKSGKPKRKPGDENYPETLDIGEGLKQARKNVGASKCWKGYKAKGTKIKNGKQVPNCVPEENEIDEGKTPITRQAGDFRYPGRTGEEKAEARAKRLSKSKNPADRRRANTIRSRVKTAADRDTARASSDARQKLYRGQQRRANDLAQQNITLRNKVGEEFELDEVLMVTPTKPTAKQKSKASISSNKPHPNDPNFVEKYRKYIKKKNQQREEVDEFDEGIGTSIMNHPIFTNAPYSSKRSEIKRTYLLKKTLKHAEQSKKKPVSGKAADPKHIPRRGTKDRFNVKENFCNKQKEKVNHFTKKYVHEDVNISGGNVGTIVIGGESPKK